MNASKIIVRQTVSKDIDLRRSADATAGAPGRKLGEEMHVEATPDRIRVRAYEIYQARNGAPGDAVSDWCQAEAELMGRATSGPVSAARDAGPATLEVKTRPATRRQPATSVRGGLQHAP